MALIANLAMKPRFTQNKEKTIYFVVCSHWFHVLYTPYISRGFYFREFRESGASREFNNTRKYLPPIRTYECDLCTQY